MNDKIEKFKQVQFTGSMESLKEMVKNLKLDVHDYYFDVAGQHLYIPKQGLRYSVGSYYICPFEENSSDECKMT